MIALVLLVLALCAVLPNRIVVAALPVFWILERLLPANLALIAQIGPVKLAPTDLVIAVLFAKFIVSVVLREELVIDRWLYVALGAYVAVNLLASIFAGLKFGETQLLRCAVSWSRFVAEMLLVVVAAQAVRTLAQAKVCLRIVLGTLVILAAIQFVNFAGAGHGFVIGEVQGLERGEIRFFGPVGDSIGVVLLLGYLVSLCFVNLAGVAFFLGGILLTAGFGAVISAAVATGLFLLFGLRGAAFGQFLRRGLWLLPVVVVAGVALAFFAKPGTQTLLGRLTSGRYTESGSQRAASTKLASAMILDNPVLGVGYMGYEQALERYDAYFDLSKPDGGTANANNQILQALTDGGIFGLLAFAAVIISASRLFLRVAWRSEDRFFYAYFLAAFLWLLTQVFGNLAACWLNPSSFVARLLWISLGVAVAVARLLPAAEPRLVRPAAERREPAASPRMKKSLRVLHVITAFDRGGAENNLLDLVRHQTAESMEVTIAYLRGRGSLAKEASAWHVQMHALRLRFYGDPRPLRRLRRIIAQGEFDLVHAHLPPAELYVRCALLRTSTDALPLIISKHNDCPFHSLPAEQLMARWVARRASGMIAISDAVRRYMSDRRIGIAPCRLVTIPYGIDVTLFDQVSADTVARLRQDWGADEETLVVGFVGRLVEQKSIETLIRGFALFVRQSQCDAKLVIVGEGPLRAALGQRASESGVNDRVVWAGFRADIAPVMKAFDVFALTSVFEGFGLVLAEAMAARRPVVATRVSAIPEVVVDGETGLLARPRSPQSVAGALAQLSDRATRARYGAAGYRRVFEHFTLERMWQATDALYTHCLRSRAVPETTRDHAAATAA